MKFRFLSYLVLASAVLAFAATETLFSNWTFSVAPGDEPGSLWVFSQNGMNSGVTLLSVSENKAGVIDVVRAQPEMVSDSVTAVQGKISDDQKAETRRISWTKAGPLGLVLPMITLDDEGQFLQPKGFFSIRGFRDVNETPLDFPAVAANVENPMDYTASGFAFDEKKSVLWVAQGVLGVLKYDISKGEGNPEISRYFFDRSTKKMVPVDESVSIDLKKYTAIYDVTVHPGNGDILLSTAKGLWSMSGDGKMSSASPALDSMRVVGAWAGGNPLQIIAETSVQANGSQKGGLWRSFPKSGKDFSKVSFLDIAKVVQKNDIYNNSGYTVTNVAFIEKEAFVGVWVAGGILSGYLKLDSLGARGFILKDETDCTWLHGFESGVTDRETSITSITTFPMDNGKIGLAVSTDGNGISVSADNGEHWTPILNRAELSGNLGTVRMVPSVITAGSESLVSYKVGKDSKITIEVFSYDMKKVRTIVKSAPRFKSISRSTDAKEDVWDGLDEYGRPCTQGVYYVRVKDNHGHVGWGKVMTLGGQK